MTDLEAQQHRNFNQVLRKPHQKLTLTSATPAERCAQKCELCTGPTHYDFGNRCEGCERARACRENTPTSCYRLLRRAGRFLGAIFPCCYCSRGNDEDTGRSIRIKSSILPEPLLEHAARLEASVTLDSFENSENLPRDDCSELEALPTFGNLPLEQIEQEINFDTVVSGKSPPPFTKQKFVDFLKSKLCAENIEFYDAVLAYRKKALDSDPQTRNLALQMEKDILERFIYLASKREVNLSAEVRSRVISTATDDLQASNPTVEVFDKAVAEVKYLLIAGPFERFLEAYNT